MNVSKAWTRAVLAAIIIPVFLVAASNGMIDAYGVFGDGTGAPSPNMSFVKVRRLLREPDKFDSFVFGSSRAANIDIRKLPGKWYNLFYAAGLPEEHLEHLRFLLRKGVPVRNVLISLDDFSFLFDPRDHLSELDLQPHPGVSGKSLHTFYAEYLFKLNKLSTQLKVHFNRPQDGRTGPFQFDLAGSGMVTCKDCDQTIEQNRAEHIRSTVFLRPWEYRFRETDNLEGSLRALRAVVALSRERGIRTTLVINPIHRTTYLNAHLARFARFKEGLAGITDYYDFSGLNPVTSDNYYYYETSHYRPLVGDMMLKVMFGAPDIEVPPGFGVRVTSENVSAHLAAQCRQVQEIAGQVPLSDENRDYAARCVSKIPEVTIQAGPL